MISADAEKNRQIQRSLQSLLTGLQKREPLDPCYDSLLPASTRKHIKSTNANKDSGTPSKAGKKSSNVITADVKLHKRLHANLRATVETYASTPAGWKRRPNTRRIDLDFGSSSSQSAGGNRAANTGGNANPNASGGGATSDELESKLRAAFALRESKEHEQRDLVNATLKVENAKMRRSWGLSQVTGASVAGSAGAGMGGAPMMGMLPPLEEASARKKRLDGVAKMLKDVEKGAEERLKLRKLADRGRDMIFNPNTKVISLIPKSSPESSLKTTPGVLLEESTATPSEKRKYEESDTDMKQQIAQAKKRERGLRERIDRQEAENKRRLEKEREERERRERAVETPQDALHRIYEPIFKSLWDMEFSVLQDTNPFRIVINEKTSLDMGIPDYCKIIEKPMNLAYIQKKVNDKSYETLQEFVEDVDLIVTNCLKFNDHPENPYNIAAKELRKRFKKLIKPVVQSLTKGQS
mmetsp:Transcript_22112/g.44871  ORF Transcript_22112/g.44871 Transcript_22112/m.44871 type:complete len:469 (-) Transcript_22112:235-1641(-)